jgi:hypothetical protein
MLLLLLVEEIWGSTVLSYGALDVGSKADLPSV